MFTNNKLRNPVTVLGSKPSENENIATSNVGTEDISITIQPKYASVFANIAEEEEEVYNDMEKRRAQYRAAAKAKATKEANSKMRNVGAVLPNGSTFKPVTVDGELEVEDTPKKTRTKKQKDDEPEVDPRESVDFYEKRFEKPLQLVTGIISEFDAKKDMIETEITELRAKSNRNGAILEYIAKQDSNVTSLLNNKLSAVKEVTNIYSKISDLEMKKSAQTSKVAGAENSSATISKIYERMMGEKDPFSLNDLYDSGYLKEFSAQPMSYNDAVEQDLDKRYMAALQNGGIQETSADINLKYADRQVEIRVHRSECNDNWRFVAVDLQLEEEIPDYAKPSVVGTMRFDFDNLIARDNLRSYPLVLIPAEVDINDDVMFISDFRSNDDDDDNGYFGYHR